MSAKKRIMFVGEASFLSTGFSTYYRELLPRLVATGKYEIAEVGSYARHDDPKVAEFIAGRWKFYGTMPRNQQEAEIFNRVSPNPADKGQNINQFGAHVFDSAVADFQPDIVIDIRDAWMCTWQQRSPFRPWFKWILMPTVDSEPQAEEWIRDYEKADAVLTYSDYGVHALKRQSPMMRVFPKPMRPGVDISTFKPMDKAAVREKYLLRKDLPTVLSVMRNQSRKLYPDLIDAFALMKNKYADKHRAVKEAVLVLHTAWPDNAFSYDYPRHIFRLHSYPWMPNARKGIKDDILQTLMCVNPACQKNSLGHAIMLFDKPLQNGRVMQFCKHCHQMSATCPSSGGTSFSREQLSEIYNLADVYVQCSIAEGDGMPVQEAKACGIPTIVTDYSALAEKGRYPAEYSHLKGLGLTKDKYTVNKGGVANKVLRYRHEPETGCLRAMPDLDHLADEMMKLLVDQDKRATMSREARECVEENYDWDKLYKHWEFVLDSVKVKDREATWNSPIVVTPIPTPASLPANLSEDAFLEWLYLNVLKYPKIDPDGALHWKQQMAAGVTRDQIFGQFQAVAAQGDNGENVRQRIRQAVHAAKNGITLADSNESEWM
jgi:glycosyltransferase involved in cell wall biosynthesis